MVTNVIEELELINDLKKVAPPSVINNDPSTLFEMTGDLDFGCIYCGDTGYKMDGSKCEGEKCTIIRENKEKETLTANRSNRYPFPVPMAYIDREWDYNTAVDNKPTFQDKSESYQQVCLAMDRILTRAKTNTLLKDRIVLSLAPNMGRKLWAFTLLRIAYNNGITVHPLRMLYDIPIEEASERQLLILNATKIDFFGSMDKLDHILAVRELKDYVTIVVSDVNLNLFISKLDNRPIHFDIAIGYNQ